ncbi:MAG: DUF3422 domain-containing protein [Mycobacterium sp.]|nr:MAG: DUF3422 domain-containing protein [Mycobacterium sp.]
MSPHRHAGLILGNAHAGQPGTRLAPRRRRPQAARDLVPRMADLEARLAELTRDIEDEQPDDRQLLDELTKLAAVAKCEIATHAGRFDAATAYYANV